VALVVGLELHEGEDEDVIELFDDAVALHEEFTEVGEQVDEVSVFVFVGTGGAVGGLEVQCNLELVFAKSHR
jgi:hypothetical protein